ncbi:MauE/DoxX family redox-associated membrane protein [Microbacterium sp. 2MCAF23]|uniref:MauE/DoxX family redox-associated membrane protein n=1 Tax=Microbacterium sp. 2MCAF23 TaxID=3232985 RepID=UPI003F9AAC37
MTLSPVEIAVLFSTGLSAFVFALSGATKLGRTDTTLAAMTALHVPALLRRRIVAGALPWAELLLALLLIVTAGPLRSLFAALAAVALVLFSGLLIGVLRRGEQASCGCFGTLSAEDTITWWAVVRNAFLVVCAVAIAVLGAASAPFFAALAGLPISAVLTLVVLWLVTAVIVLIRTIVVLHHRPTGTDVGPAPVEAQDAVAGMGDPIPATEVVSIDGRTRQLRTISLVAPTVLLFLSAECSSCREAAARIPDWQAALGPVQIRVITSSDPSALRERLPETTGIAYFGSAATKQALAVPGSPSAVLIGARTSPVVGSPVVRGVAEIDALVRSIAAART